MNLWVKRTGQLFMAVLFLMSCEDDSFLLGFKNQNKKFEVRYQEISLESSSLLMDSAITDNTVAPVRFLVGRYVDNMLGEVRSEAYSEFYPLSDTIRDEANSVLDSLVIKLRFDNYVYGEAGTTTETFSLHRITENFNHDIFVDSLNFHYYYNNTLNYDPTPIATIAQVVDYEDLTGSNASQDTLLLKFKLESTDPFALEIFNYIKNHTSEDDSTFYANFREQFKGLVLVPSSSNNKVLGFNNASALSGLVMSYHAGAENYTLVLNFSSPYFNKISTDRSASDLAGLTAYQDFSITDNRFVQAGSPVVTKLDLANFYSFLDTIPNLQINSAELVITPNGVEDGLEPPTIVIQLHNENNNLFMNRDVKADRDRLTGYTRLFAVGDYIAAGSDYNVSSLVSPALLSYDNEQNKMTGFVTLFLQDLIDNRDKEDKINFISLNPFSPNIGKSVNRLVFNKNNVKLRIHYTKPILTNL